MPFQVVMEFESVSVDLDEPNESSFVNLSTDGLGEIVGWLES